MRLWIALLFSVVASAQTAVWPGSAATDSQLLVGANLCQTRLSQPINDTTSTTIFVTNSSVTSPYCFVVNQEVQIDNEFMKVTSVAFGQMTVTRGFDYSTASTHQINAPVVNNVAAAWYHNALAKEIESIEAWLAAGGGGGGGGGVCGVNGSIQYNNLGACGGYAVLPAAVLPAATNAAQGAVQLPTLGTSNVLGTTASGVQASTVITVTQPPYNADPTGIADSTAAIAAACADMRAVHGTLFFPAGVYLTDPITCITSYGMTFEGSGPEGTILKSRAGGDIFDVTSTNIIHSVAIKNMRLLTTGSGAIGINTSGSFPNLWNIEKVTIFGDGQCIYMPQEFDTIINGISCQSASYNGIEISGDNTTIVENSYVETVGANKAAYVLYGGVTTMLNDNGINATSGANATWAVIGQSPADGDKGIGNTPTPLAYVSGGTPTGTGTCLLSATNGDGGGGTGALLTMSVSSGSVTGFAIASAGSSYASIPTSWNLVSSSPNGTCASSVTTSGGTLVNQQSFAEVNFYGCNMEDFTKWGVWIKSASQANFYGSTFLAYLGTTTEAIHSDTSNATSVSVLDSTTDISTAGAWTNGYAIHNAGNGCTLWVDQTRNSTSTTGASCYSDAQSLVYTNSTWTKTSLASGVSGLNIPYISSSGAYLTGPHLGTPHDAILTNATGLPLSGHVSQAADSVVMNQTGSSAPPTAIGMPTGGTNGCAGGTNALIYNTSTHQLGCNTLNPYGAFSGWGAVTADFGGTATQYAPYIGGATTNGTETIVSLAASSTATISHLSVSLSAQIGASATLAVTLEDGTATPTALTCTTAAGGTTCVDNSHSVNVTQGDLLSFKLVAGGSVSAGTPKLTISYTIGVTSATIIQGGVASLIAPVVTSGSTENTIISGPVPANSVSAGTLYRINAVCSATSGAGSGTNHLYAHYGTTGTSADTSLGQLFGSSPTTGTNVGFIATMYVTFTSTTATTLTGGYTNSASNSGAWPILANSGFGTNTTSLNTTVNKFLTLTAQSDGGTTVFTCNPGTSIEVVKP